MTRLIGIYGFSGIIRRIRRLSLAPGGPLFLLIWCASLIAAVFSGIAVVVYQWSGIALQHSDTTLHITLYPPMLIATLWVLWFGFWWGASIAFLSTLSLSLYSGMLAPLAIIFSFADPLGLAVLAVAYRAMPFNIDLHSLRNLTFFIMISFVAAIFSSSGAFIWTYSEQLSMQDAHAIWEGWWIGALAQNLIVIAPLLWLGTRSVRRWREFHLRRLDPPPLGAENALAIVALIFCAIIGYLLISLQLGRLMFLQIDTNNPAFSHKTLINGLADTTSGFIGIICVVIGFVTFFGLKLFGYRTKALQSEVKQRRSMQRQLERQNKLLAQIAEISAEIQSAKSFSEALERVQYHFPRLMPETSGILYIRNEDDHLQRYLHWGTFQGAIPHLDEEASGAMPDSPYPQSALCLPLMHTDTQFGVLWLSHMPNNLMEDPGVTQNLLEQLTLSLSNRKLQDQLAHEATHDLLTGLFNRRHMQEWMIKEIARSKRTGEQISALMVDIDKFKQLNDHYGHQMGDQALQVVSRYLSQHIREHDLSCRYGGEEFLLLMTDSDQQQACDRAEAIRQGVEGLFVRQGEQRISGITVSIGIATFPDHGQDAESLLLAADMALYAAKNSGRNRCMIAPRPANSNET
ncbi:sensor domain-containing diguanylate cyclase [Marinobacterium jannaschii]|uniref:sensor domain-containing diguanylate cyclase n=1 Tax=Marinobacterium jannaschii TaxID=64970 RepID=UPI000685F0DB|nr:GGDEF domain-containing protein [Marinobacterium jannaschii]